MAHDITIPPAALEAGVKAFAEAEEDAYTTHAEDLRAAMVAALNAWPGVKHYDEMRVFGEPHSLARLILPLPTEASDE